MSATADADLFARYFESALHRPVALLTIPGLTHPVTDLFLEDALEETGFVVGKSSKWAKKAAAGKEGGGGKGGRRDGGGKGGGEAGGGKEDAAGEYSAQTLLSLQVIDESLVNYDLIESLVVRLAAQELGRGGGGGGDKRAQAGAILVFAPGADEIARVVRALQNSGRLAAQAPGGVRVLPLHGGLPPSHQSRVFERPPPGVLKVVVATNVAETSITIDDVTCVVDCGRVKEMRFDPDRGIARLLEGWVSKASAQQRRGRAGRVRPGVCYRLFSRKTWGGMAKDTPPEVARAPLQGLVMDVKGILRGADAAAALADMITPPSAAAVAQAVAQLQGVGALDKTPASALTPLGLHLTRMPCDPRIAKMLVFGAMLRCLDPILTIAAAQGFGRPAFFSPPDKRAEADAARAALTRDVSASKSDHLEAVAAYNEWRAALARGGRREAAELCQRSFVSEQAMEAVHAGRRQYAEILADLGFVPQDYPGAAAAAGYNPGSAGGAAGSAAAEAFTRPGGVDQFAGHARVVKAVLCAGLYPQLLRVDAPAAKFQHTSGGAFEVDATAKQLKFFDRERGRVFLHPSSSNFNRGRFESGWLVFSELVQTSKVFVRESSMVPVYSVLLFGGELGVSHGAGVVRVDGWATFRAPARIAVLVRELRAEVAALLGRKVADPGVDLSSSRVVEAMHHLLASDGF
jgi:ATP-dependent RNA helicase DHX57